MRQGPWKLLHNPNDQADARKLAPPDREWFLANVDEDEGERTNQAPRHATFDAAKAFWIAPVWAMSLNAC